MAGPQQVPCARKLAFHKEAQQLFLEPEVLDPECCGAQVEASPMKEELVRFMCGEKQFSRKRIPQRVGSGG